METVDARFSLALTRGQPTPTLLHQAGLVHHFFLGGGVENMEKHESP